MPAANSSNITTIQILRSYSNSAPVTLDDGQLAYSFVSNTLFIGSNTGVKIIGDPSTAVKSQAAYDQANTATVLANGAYFHANGAFLKANAAFDNSNTKLSLSGGTITGPISGPGESKLDFTTYGSNTVYLTTTNDDSTALFMGAMSAELYANTSVQIRTNTKGTSQNWTFDENGSLTFPDNTIQTTAYTPGGEIDELARATANAAYFHANGAFLKANAGYNQANTGTVLAQASYNQANVTIGVDASQNVRIDYSNTALTIAQGVDNSQNVRLDFSNTRMTIIEGVDVGQNNRMAIIEGTNASQNVRLNYSNTAITIIQGVDVTQNTRLTVSEGVDLSQNVSINTQNSFITIIQGVDVGQNARMTIIEGVDVSQNTRMTVSDGVNTSQNVRLDYSNTALVIAQGVDNSQNVRLDYSNTALTIAQGVDNSQNVRLDFSNTRMTIIEGTDTSQNNRMSIIEGVDVGQNTAIAATDGKMQAAYFHANGAFIKANSAFDVANVQIGVDNTQNTRMTVIEGTNVSQNARMTIIEGVDVTQNTNIANKLSLSGAASQLVTGNVVFGNDVTVTGNLIVLGNTISLNVTSFEVEDTLIQLGIGNYTTDVLSIGYVGHYNDGTNAHAGFIRDALTKEFYAFQGYTPEVTGNVININAASFAKANIHGNWFKGNLIATTARVGGLDVNNFATAAFNQANTGTVLAQASFNQANATVGVDATQNTRLTVIEGTNASQNVRLDFSNTRMTIIENTNLSQNVRLAFSNTRMDISDGVNASQNVRLDYSNTVINQVSSAWTANTVIVANSTGYLANSNMRWNNVQNQLILGISGDTGNLAIGTTTSVAPITVVKTYITPTGGEQFGSWIQTAYGIADTSLKQGLRLNTSTTHTSNTISNAMGVLNLMTAGGVGGTTTSLYGYWARNDVVPGAYVTNSYLFFVNDGGNTGNANNQYGYYTSNLTKGLLSNYGFYGAVNTGNNAYNLYMAGTAPNYLAGSLTVANNIPSTSNTTGSLVVTGGLGVSGNTFLNNSLAAVTTTASAVNYVQVTGGTTTVDAKISAQGSDTNVGMSYSSKGSFFHRFWTNNFNNEQFRIVHTASSVNYLQITGATTGNAPSITVEGSDSNIPLNIQAKLAAPINFFTSGGYQQFKINNTATAVNYLEVTGGTASGPNGNGASISVQGSSTDADMYLAAKGLGRINVASKMIVGNAAFGTYPSSSAPFDGLIVANTSTGGAIGFGGTNGRTLSAYQNGVLNNFDFNATQTFYSGDLLVTGRISSPNGTSANLQLTTTDANATIFINRTVYISNANNSVSNTTGGLVVRGGIATGGAIYSTGGSITINNGLATTGNSGTIFLGDSSFSKTFGSGFIFNSSISAQQFVANAGSNSAAAFTFSGVGNLGIYAPLTGVLGITANSANALFVSAPTSSVNYLQVSANTTGKAPTLTSAGSDTNIDINILSKGTGSVNLLANGSVSFSAGSSAGGPQVAYLKTLGTPTGGAVYTGIISSDTNTSSVWFTKGSGSHFFNTNSGTITQFLVSHTASAVNYVQVNGNTTGNGPTLRFNGSDTNIEGIYAAKGSGSHRFFTNDNNQEQFRVSHTASAVNYVQVTGNATTGAPYFSAQGTDSNISLGYTSKGIAGHIFSTGGTLTNLQFVINNTTSAVNYIQVAGNAAGQQPYFLSAGSDTNVGITYATKGTGPHFFSTGGGTLYQFEIASTASAVNYVRVTGAATGGTPTVSAQGSDSNITLLLTGKGSGGIVFDNPGYGNYFSATSAGATTTNANHIRVTGTISGVPAVIGAVGSDTNIGINITPKGNGSANITSTANSTSNTSGALVVTGGIGVTGNVFLSSANNFTSGGPSYRLGWTDTYLHRDASTNYMRFEGSAFVVQTGIFFSLSSSVLRGTISNNTGNNTVLFAGSSPVRIQNTAPSTSNTTGSLIVDGGLGLSGNLSMNLASSGAAVNRITLSQANFIYSDDSSSGSIVFGGSRYYYFNAGDIYNQRDFIQRGLIKNDQGNNTILFAGSSPVRIQNTAASTSNTTGSLIVDGGIGVTGNVFLSSANNFSPTTSSVSYRLGWSDNYFSRNPQFSGMDFTGGYFNTNNQLITTGALSIRNIVNNDAGNNTIIFSGQSGLLIQNGASSISNTTGALIVRGGLGLSGNLSMNLASSGAGVNRINLGQSNFIDSQDFLQVRFAGVGYYYFSASSGVYIDGLLRQRAPISNDTGNNTVIFAGSSPVKIQNGTGSSNTTTGALVVQGGVGISGALNATTKSFNIPHPTKEGKDLRYGSLEGPEFGVYVRGILKGSNVIELPEYWTKLVDANTITVSLTPIGKHQKLSVKEIKDNTILINSNGWFKKEIHCYYTVFGERADVDKLDVEG